MVTHENGDKANGNGYLFDNHGGKQPSATGDMNWAVTPSRANETFHAQVTLECPNGNDDILIAAKDFTLLTCDPSLLRKSANEYARADILSGEADAKVYKTQGDWEQWLAEEESEFVKISFEKPTLLEVFKGTAKDAGYELIADKLVHFFEFDIGPALTGYWIVSDVEPHILAHDADLKEVQQLDDQASLLYKEALADFKAELTQEPACQEQAKAQRAKEDLAQKKRDLIETWDQNEDGHYWNPTRQEWEQEKFALKAAEQILTNPRKLQAEGSKPLIPKPRNVRIDAAQAKAALIYIERALKLHKSALTRERQAVALTVRFANSMRRLLNEG